MNPTYPVRATVPALDELFSTPHPSNSPSKRQRLNSTPRSTVHEDSSVSDTGSRSSRTVTSTFLEDLPTIERRLLLAEHHVSVKSLASQQQKLRQQQLSANSPIELTPLQSLPTEDWIRRYITLFARLLNEHNLPDLVRLLFSVHHHEAAKHVARVWVPSTKSSIISQFSCNQTPPTPLHSTPETVSLASPPLSQLMDAVSGQLQSNFDDTTPAHTEQTEKALVPHMLCWQEYLGVSSSIEYLRLLFIRFPDSVFEIMAHSESATAFGMKVVVYLRFRGTLVTVTDGIPASLDPWSSSSMSSSSTSSRSFDHHVMEVNDISSPITTNHETTSTSLPPSSDPFAWMIPPLASAASTTTTTTTTTTTGEESSQNVSSDRSLSEMQLMVYCSIFFDNVSNKIYETWSDVVMSNN